MIAEEVMKKMRQGSLITHPSDKRSFGEIGKWLHEYYENLSLKDKIFHAGDLASMGIFRKHSKEVTQYDRE